MDVFLKQSPITTFTKDISQTPRYVIDDKFTFMFALADNANTLISEEFRKLKPYIIYQEINTDRKKEGLNTLTDQIFQLEKCTADRVSPELSQILIQPLESYWCFPRNTTFELSGTFGTYKSKQIKINVDLCQNSTSNNNSCYDIDTIKRTLPFTNFMYYMSDNFIDHYQTKPMVSNIISGLLKTTSNTFTRNYFWLKNVDYHSDEGFITKTDTTYSGYSTDTFNQESYTNPSNSNTIFSHIISLKPTRDVYYRSYMKVQGAIALIGGFISGFRLFFLLIVKYLVNPEIVGILSQHLKINLDVRSKNTNIGISGSASVNNLVREREKIPANTNTPTLPLTKFESFIRIFTCCIRKNTKKKITDYKTLKKKIMKVMSFENLSSITRKLKILRNIYFEEYQRKASNSIVLHQNKSNLQINESLEMVNSTSMNPINQKIIKLLDMKPAIVI